MKNSLLKIGLKLTVTSFLIFGLVAIFIACNDSGKVSSGILTYVIIPEPKDTSQNPLLTSFLTSMKYDMASDGKQSVVYSENTQGKLYKFLTKGMEGQVWFADDGFGKKKISVSKLNLENILNKNKQGYMEDKTKIKEILGFSCYMVTLSTGTKDNVQNIELYVTDKIDYGFKQPLGFNLDIPGLDATILEAKFIPENVNAKNIGFTLTAKTFLKSVPKELLSQPKDTDFESITFDSYLGQN